MSSMFRDVIVKMMQSITLDEDHNIEVVDEQLKEEADELLGQLVIETARRWWMECEDQEDSLSDMEDEISFDEKHGGRDSLRTPALGKSKKKKDENTVESILGMEEFDVSSILEMDDDEDVRDGDDEYDDMLRGDDDMGHENHFDDMEDEDDMDAIGGEHEDFGPEEDEEDFGPSEDSDEEFDFSFLNDEDDDDIEMDDDFVMHGDDDDMDKPESDDEDEEGEYGDFEENE